MQLYSPKSIANYFIEQAKASGEQLSSELPRKGMKRSGVLLALWTRAHPIRALPSLFLFLVPRRFLRVQQSRLLARLGLALFVGFNHGDLLL